MPARFLRGLTTDSKTRIRFLTGEDIAQTPLEAATQSAVIFVGGRVSLNCKASAISGAVFDPDGAR
jgi:hypothetical protein